MANIHSAAATLLLIFILLNSRLEAQNAYYLDSKLGNDRNSGMNPATAWKTISKVNTHTFIPGDTLLIKAGTRYVGQLAPKGSGKNGSPISIRKYGNGNLPRIDGQGIKKSTVLLYNVAFWELHDLEVTNQGNSIEAGRTGVSIVIDNFGDAEHIYLKNLVIHDVNGSLVKDDGGGSAIYWSNAGEKIISKFIDLRIENCHLYKCQRNGIISWGYTDRNNWHPSLGVVIRNNLLEEIPGDGIVPIGCDGALIENNIMRNGTDILSHEEAAAGIWPWSSDNTLIQYNEVSDHKAKWDGQGFDSDWNCKNTVIQYNYSHDNFGGFLLVCNNGENIHTNMNAGTSGTIIRYNVSVNDGLRPYPTARAGKFSPVLHITGPCENTSIYNNIIFVKRKPSREIDRAIIRMENWGGPWPKDTHFYNNIFYSLDSSTFVFGKDINTTFRSNTFFGDFKGKPEDKSAILADPLFTSPDKIGSGIKSLIAFCLKANSPCINAGIRASETEVIRDFFGTLVDSLPDAGIHELVRK